MPLSDLTLRNAKKAEKPYKLTDGDGLYVYVTINGSKLWRMNYRLLGRQHTLSLGQYPEVTLQAARQKKLEAKQLIAEGRDPSEEKKAEKIAARLSAANTFDALVDEYLGGLRKRVAEVTVGKQRWVLKDLICPKLGKRPIAEIRPSEVLEVLAEIEASGRNETAIRARQVVGAVFRLAALTDRAPGDPTHLLRRMLKPPKVESHPAIIHEASFGQLIRTIDTYPNRPIVRLALLFLAHTFPRPIEMRLAKWSDIDLEEGVWHIPAEITKMRRPHDVPIVAATRGILKEVANATGRTEGLIFPSPYDWKKPLSENTLNKALSIMGYKRLHTSHGFRSSASTILHERDFRSAVIETQLAHLEGSETKRAYNRAQYWDERVALMKAWADIIKELRVGSPKFADSRRPRATEQPGVEPN